MDRGIRKALEGKRVSELVADESPPRSEEDNDKNNDDTVAAR